MTVDIEGVPVHLAHSDELPVKWVGQEELMRQLLAAWMVLNDQDLPMNPRLLGKPGVGKTTLAYAAAKRMGRDVYILQATMDTRPEDLHITPVIEAQGKLRYVASPLVSTMNDDASTFELPEYIHSRLQPQIWIDFPERDEEYQILKENLPFAEERILTYVTDFLQRAHAADERYTARDGINIGRYAIKLASLATDPDHERQSLETAVLEIVGEEALRYTHGS